MLPDGDGSELLREFDATSRTPVVMLTARGEEVERVLGLELGADDYVTKPFSAAELAARVRAVLRRADFEAPAEVPGAVLEVGDVRMNLERHEVDVRWRSRRADREGVRALTHVPRARRAGRKREQLIREVWDTSWFGSTKTLDVHVSALRQEAGDDPSAPRYIHTVRGVGFRFASLKSWSRHVTQRGSSSRRSTSHRGRARAVDPARAHGGARAESDFRSAVLGDAAVLAARVADHRRLGSRSAAASQRDRLVAENASDP